MYSNFPPWSLVCPSRTCSRTCPVSQPCVLLKPWYGSSLSTRTGFFSTGMARSSVWDHGCQSDLPRWQRWQSAGFFALPLPACSSAGPNKVFSAALKTLKSGCWLAKTRNYCVFGWNQVLLNKARLGLLTVRPSLHHQTQTVFSSSWDHVWV